MSLTMSDCTQLKTWVNRETKTRFATIARRQGLSDSALLKRLIDTMLQAGNSADGVATEGRAVRVSRFSIRLRPDDQILLRERAASRGMPAATYVSVLTRAHLRSLSPLPNRAGSGADGSSPSALIQGVDGVFYGTTANGGLSNLGTAFKF
jgi:hypothetical protein